MIEVRLIKVFDTWLEIKISKDFDGFKAEIINATTNKAKAKDKYRFTKYILAKAQQKLERDLKNEEENCQMSKMR